MSYCEGCHYHIEHFTDEGIHDGCECKIQLTKNVEVDHDDSCYDDVKCEFKNWPLTAIIALGGR